MIGWVSFGCLVTLASALGLTTVYYRRRARRAETKSGQSPSQSRARSERKYKGRVEGAEARFLQPTGSQAGAQLPEYFIGGEGEETGEFCPEDETGGVFGDRYDRHGVRIEQNCFI